MTSEPLPGEVEQLLESADLAGALENERFKQFLDKVPVAIAVAQLHPSEHIVYANDEFERLTGQPIRNILGGTWDRLPGHAVTPPGSHTLGAMVESESDYVGAFCIPRDDAPITVDAWSNIIEDDDGVSAFRLVALVEAGGREGSILDQLQEKVLEKDTQLRELQHRVKNNLQMITALIRIEAKGVTDRSTGEGFDRLAGRVEALGLLYRSLSESDPGASVDLGIYLSEVASAVMKAHAVEGIHLDLQVDVWPVSIDVAMPAGLVVNELLTNALKHAFVGRTGGAITLHCLTEGAACRVVVADDGIGLPDGLVWPKSGKLSALIVRSLLQNARASLTVVSAPDQGTRVTILFDSADAAPEG